MRKQTDMVVSDQKSDVRPFSDNAIALHGKGVCPIPCDGKKPLVSNWQSFSYQQANRDRVDGWIIDYPNANIGAVMGMEVLPGYSLICIDIDDDRVTSAVVSLLGGGELCAKTGKKGVGIFALAPSRLTKTRHYQLKSLGTPVIEILAQKSQTILPPSIHPDTKQSYKWLNKSICETDFAALQHINENILWISPH